VRPGPSFSSGFLPGPRLTQPPTGSGTLDGLCFAIKDNIDVKGTVTGAGNPSWAATHPAPTATAPLVQQLLLAGATLTGKTVLEELAYSLVGDNRHFDTVRNEASPDRHTGGSSSGSAAVVAAGKADFSLGTDTAGSIRVPASNCGLIGLRPGHGALNPRGIVPLAPSFDVPGWLARDPAIFCRVGEVLLPPSSTPRIESGILLEPALRLLDSHYSTHFCQALQSLSIDVCGSSSNIRHRDFDLPELAEALRVLQAREAWQQLGEWAANAAPGAVSPDIDARILSGREVGSQALRTATDLRERVRDEMHELLASCGALVMPTVPCPALPLASSVQQRQEYRKRIVQLTCIASLTGLPEISLPLITTGGIRMGVSVLGPHGSERALLTLLKDK
tara:strand:+ start:128182 stop:129357 length:1176 start_codon:yes stop_codon:yes gene_type:complete